MGCGEGIGRGSGAPRKEADYSSPEWTRGYGEFGGNGKSKYCRKYYGNVVLRAVWYRGGWTRQVCWFALYKLVVWSALKTVKMEEGQICVFKRKLVVWRNVGRVRSKVHQATVSGNFHCKNVEGN